MFSFRLHVRLHKKCVFMIDVTCIIYHGELEGSSPGINHQVSVHKSGVIVHLLDHQVVGQASVHLATDVHIVYWSSHLS